MASSSEPFPARSEDDLGVADDFSTFVTGTKRMLEATSIDSPVKKRAKTISSHEHDLILNHVAAFLKDTRRTGKLHVWYNAHRKLYDHLQARRAEMLAHSSIDNKVDTLGQVTKHNDLDISENSDTHRNYFEVLLGRLETALEKHCPKTHDKNQPNAAKDPNEVNNRLPCLQPSKFTHSQRSCSASRQALAQHPFLAQDKTIENTSAVNGSKAEPPRRGKARSYFPARRSRGTSKGGFISCTPIPLTSTSKNTTPEPKPEPAPLPLPSHEFIDRGQSNFRPKAIPGTKAERLAQYMKYWPRLEKPDENAENHDGHAAYLTSTYWRSV
ncbi:hypothetical protein NEUTE1DRAFT_137142 [Neurospora tetrasperma FGSC 2508]|uniref:Uncharacterized protein n=1 Tax=Neurospora tetrasperma (strain FGSC 2508 / ATCC MYA-4615 / P0657) TaxID=510951 RepID=F8MJQ3_NEUT8|nr:uncharacterized protein NEUTE1DRAFT_137142 [Neurospora tetrasperma FGSC 2508]EGO57294.1 hypothetical protein NEUTE1DRAFT_137142 [Neurospora tetrasperma FGSC 2508]EGZ72454.1 hypothetical protein NEUTE2DRAFT_129810 [Neurospora tetrasperma FGSC 2509]